MLKYSSHNKTLNFGVALKQKNLKKVLKKDLRISWGYDFDTIAYNLCQIGYES